MKFRDARALIAVVLLPLLCAGLLLWSFAARTDSISRVNAAVVNQDTGTTIEMDGKSQFVPFGRQLVAELLKPGKDTFNWQIVKADTAQKGLKTGEYTVVVMIPKDFSKQVGTIGTTKAAPASIQVITNDADSTLISRVSTSVAEAAARGLGKELTTRVLDTIYLGFEQQKDGLIKAADGASQLQEGSAQLSDGLAQAGQGANQLGAGSQQYVGGVNQLLDGVGLAGQGANQLSAGIGQGAQGAAQLSAGLQAFRDGFVGTSTQDGLMTGLEKVQAGINGNGATPGLADGSKQLADGLAQLNDGFKQLESQIEKYRQYFPSEAQLENLSQLMNQLSASWAQLEQAWNNAASDKDQLAQAIEFLRSCPGQEDPERCARSQEFADQLAQLQPDTALRETLSQLVATTAAVVDQISANKPLSNAAQVLEQLSGLQAKLYGDGTTPGLFDAIAQLADGSRRLSDGINGTASQPGLRQGVDQLVSGARQLAAGLDGTPNSPGLVPGMRELSAGLNQANSGAAQLAAGLGEAINRSDPLRSGGQQLTGGIMALGDGLGKLESGAGQLGSGIGQLGDGLREGAGQIPSYTQKQRDDIVTMAVQPINTKAAHINPASTGATAIFPLAATIALWLGAFAIMLVMPPLRSRYLTSPLPDLAVLWRSSYPALAFALVQALLLLLVALMSGVQALRPGFAITIILVASLAFTAINQALVAAFGARLGRIISLLFLVVQAASLSGILPIATAPETFIALHELLPLAIMSAGLREALLGGNAYGWAGIIVPLVLWAGASLLVTRAAIPAARRKLAARSMKKKIDLAAAQI